MTTKHLVPAVAIATAILLLAACGRFGNLREDLESGQSGAKSKTGTTQAAAPKIAVALEAIATSDVMWTGVAVSRDGRVFVSFPRWGEDVVMSVGEIRAGGKIWPYPDEERNTWTPPVDPREHFVCVQSVYVDRNDFLWVLDPANAYLGGVVQGGAKLVKIDLRKSAVVQTVHFDETAAPARSYLNDVRIDTGRNVAYITDSGLGAILVVDLATGRTRRVLTESSTTKSENAALKVDGKQWRINGQIPQVHVDGLALDPGGKYLYYQALTGRSLYRIGASDLCDPNLTEHDLSARVESLGTTGAADGIEFGPDGYLYLTGIEESAVKVFAALGEAKIVAKDRELRWPDSLARSGEYMYVTSSQINLGEDATGPYKLFRFKVEK
jgi:sugar lactone lactonase YvrE